MIKIIKDGDQLLLEYQSVGNESVWVDHKLQSDGKVTFLRTFTFTSNQKISDDNVGSDELTDDTRTFRLGVNIGDYFRVDREVLGIEHDLLLSTQMLLNQRTFVAYRNISIFRKIFDLVNERIVIGGDAEGAISLSEFEELLQNFPTSTELTHYAGARISRTLKDYLGTMSDAQRKLETYLNRRKTIRASSRTRSLMEYEFEKYLYLREELKEMLEDSESFNEKDWQTQILNFLLLLFPKYIAVLENLQIKDFYSTPAKIKDRYIDLALVDANGALDIIEIKKPFVNSLLSRTKYRDNYTPRVELSGSVMQVEKYIFHLNKWGRDGEKAIFNKRKTELPPGFDIKITNPKAMIILGRDNDFTADQSFDFEIIKRKFANIVDIMTYDDLLRRLDNIMLRIK